MHDPAARRWRGSPQSTPELSASSEATGRLKQTGQHAPLNCLPPRRHAAPLRAAAPESRLHARRDGISAVVWATGYRREYPWLRVPALDTNGEIVQRRGITPVAGLYVVGQRFQHRRDSNFIDGVRHDAAYVARHITSRLRCHAPVTSMSYEDAS